MSFIGRSIRLAAGAVMMCATVAQAQETGSLIKRNRAAQIDEGNPNAPRLTMEAFGACVVTQSKGRVVKFVDMRVGEPDYAAFMRSMFDRTGDVCLSSGALRFHDIHFRGALFQGLYNAEYRKGPPAFGAITTSNYRALYPETLSPLARNAVALEQFGECVGRSDPQGVHDLLRSLAGSSRETALLQSLAPRFSACVPQGEKIALSKIIVKGALAEGMYRLSRTAEAGTASREPR